MLLSCHTDNTLGVGSQLVATDLTACCAAAEHQFVDYVQATAEQQVETCVGKVEAALQSKLAKTQALTQSLEQALTAVNHELAGLSRSQHRLNNMAAHLKQKAGVNKSRQQVEYTVSSYRYIEHWQSLWTSCSLRMTGMLTVQDVGRCAGTFAGLHNLATTHASS